MSQSQTRIAERYRLVRELGRGPIGSVHVAEDARLSRTVAIKRIPTDRPIDDRQAARFANEASASSDLQHEGIVRVHEAGFDASSRALYVVMELLHGETMRELFARASESDEKLDAIDGALEALAAAHAAGVAHRNLKPENVFIAHRRSGERVPTLLDLELSRIVADHGLVGVRASSPLYLAPELLSRGAATPASDVWSVGVMLYEALAGRPPFEGDPATLVDRITGAAHTPADAHDPSIEAGLARLIDFCLAKDPTQRPQDARALMRLIKTLRGGAASLVRDPARSVHDTVLDPVGTTPDPPPAELEAALRKTPRDPAVHRALAAHYERNGNTDGTWLAAAALEFLGAATADELRVHHLHRKPAIGSLDRGLDANGWAALLHADQDPRIDAVWAEVADAVSSLHRRDDRELGLSDAQKLELGKPSEELSRAFARAIGALRPGVLPRLYRGRAGIPPRHLPALPLASVFPRGFEEPLPSGALPFAVGRHVAYYRSTHRVCTVLTEPELLEAAFAAALRAGLGWIAEEPEHARLTELLKNHLEERALRDLRAACARLGDDAMRLDLGTWRRAVELSCSRAGLLMSGDLGGAAWMLRWLPERRRIPTEDAVDDLLVFWSSSVHAGLRQQLGIAVAR